MIMRAWAVGFLLLAVSAATADNYTNSKMGFSLDFPSAVTVDDKGDSIKLTQVVPGEGAFAMTATDLTGKATIVHGQEAACADGVLTGYLSKQTLLSKTPFAVPNGAGIDVLTTGDGMKTRARIYCVPPYVFMVMAGIPATNDTSAFAGGKYRTYFESFRILPK